MESSGYTHRSISLGGNASIRGWIGYEGLDRETLLTLRKLLVWSTSELHLCIILTSIRAQLLPLLLQQLYRHFKPASQPATPFLLHPLYHPTDVSIVVGSECRVRRKSSNDPTVNIIALGRHRKIISQ